MSVISVEHVSFDYTDTGGKPVEVLKDISFTAEKDEFVSIVGQSGSGKSTFLRIAAGLMEPKGGRILYNGRELHGIEPHLSFVFQDFALMPWLTNRENVKIGLSASKESDDRKDRLAEDLLGKFGLKDFVDAYPNALSGGMKQRVGIARAIASNPSVLLMDEPFSSLDELTAEELRKDIVKLLKNRTIAVQSAIMVTHNVEEAIELSDKIVIFSSKPTVVTATQSVRLKYPRDKYSKEFKVATESVLAYLSEDAKKEAMQASK